MTVITFLFFLTFQSQDQDHTGQKVATKCIRVSSTATTKAIIETLIEKFRPDMKMLEVQPLKLINIELFNWVRKMIILRQTIFGVSIVI